MGNIKEILVPNIKMEIENEFEEHRFNSFFEKEPETIAWIQEMIKRGDILFDVGANVGVYTLFAAAFYQQDIQIFSFEPVYHNFNKLCKNIILNKFENICKPYSIGLSDKTSLCEIHVRSTVIGSACHSLSVSIEDLDSQSIFEQGVAVFSLDEIVEKGWVPSPTHIKIDTDGNEEKIIQGAKKILASDSVRSVLMEITDIDNAKERIVNMMKIAGFSMDHPLNFRAEHSRVRREKAGKGYIENVIFTK